MSENDDAVPVTTEWLESTLHDTELSVSQRLGRYLLSFGSLVEVKTRGDVRAISRSLGVETRENPDNE